MESTPEEIVIQLIWKKPNTTTFDYYVNEKHVQRDELLLSVEAKKESVKSFIKDNRCTLKLDRVESDTVTKIYFTEEEQ